MTRIRPTMDDWRKARDLEWYDQNPERIEYLGPNGWLVWTEDGTDSLGRVESLIVAISIARKPEVKPNG